MWASEWVKYCSKRIDGKIYYKTGDRVELDTNGNLIYLGRFDRMIKKRGYRIESEEVEQTLMNNKNIIEAAIIESKDSDGYSFIKAFIVTRPNTAVTVLEIKEHCQKLLPPYMIPEQIIFINALPKTSILILIRIKIYLRKGLKYWKKNYRTRFHL